MVCLLETRVRPSNSAAISAISGSWKQWSSLKNSGYSENIRLWLFWKSHITVNVIKMGAHIIHCSLTCSEGAFFVTFVYAPNEATDRLTLCLVAW